MIGVVDYGIGNVKSIINMFKKIGFEAQLVSLASDVEQVSHLVLPGVGSFDHAMTKLEQSGLIESIKRHALVDQKPILGICLGMQMLGKGSEEGKYSGLNFIPFECKKFDFNNKSRLKIPHMGWDTVTMNCIHDPLVSGLVGTQRYYFVHSYYAVCENNENVFMTCDYGIVFAAAIKSGNVYGVQFHPEKSHRFGMSLLENFARIQ